MAGKEDRASYEVIRYERHCLPLQYCNLILSKWARSFRYGNDYIRLMDADNYFQSYSRYIQRVLGLTETTVRLALLPDDSDVVLGFSVVTNKTLQYVHVHKDARRQGIARALIPTDVDSFTHLTKLAMRLWPTKMPNAKFIIYAPEN